MNNRWIENGSAYHVREITQQLDVLPVAIYKTVFPDTGEPYLQRISDKFDFSFKIYGIENSFIDRVLTTYKHTESNLGILLNGIRGTGKTITAEILCNKLELPIILISEDHPNLIAFMNKIQQNVIFFIDEFEKIFKSDDYNNKGSSQLLTIMDGVLNTSFRKIFLFTTNELNIERNLIQRPGRIRYIKTFNNLDLNSIIEIIDDKLLRTEFREDTIKFISELELITVDIVSSIIEEVNIHNESPEKFADIFNIKKLSEVFNVIKLDITNNGMTETIIRKNTVIIPDIFISPDECIDHSLYVSNKDFGKIVNIKDSIVTVNEEGEWNSSTDEYDIKLVNYRIEKVKTNNILFSNYAF